MERMTREKFEHVLSKMTLIDVMSAWGYKPAAIVKDGSLAIYKCPWCNEPRPSLMIEKELHRGFAKLHFKCRAGHCGQSGFGAIELAARLMGMPTDELSAEQHNEVVVELAKRCNVELIGYINENEKRQSESMPPCGTRTAEPKRHPHEHNANDADDSMKDCLIDYCERFLDCCTCADICSIAEGKISFDLLNDFTEYGFRELVFRCLQQTARRYVDEM